MLTTDSQERKDTPIFSGFMMYFPLAVAYVARVSKIGNDKHNPGQPMRWAKEKSKDHADCVSRHLIDIGPDWEGEDEDEILHAGYLAWRSMGLLQTVLEKRASRKAVNQYKDDCDHNDPIYPSTKVDKEGRFWSIHAPKGLTDYPCT